MHWREGGGCVRKNQHRAGGCVHQQRERLAVDEVDVGAPFAQRVAARDGPRRRGRLAQALEAFLRATKDGHGADSWPPRASTYSVSPAAKQARYPSTRARVRYRPKAGSRAPRKIGKV